MCPNIQELYKYEKKNVLAKQTFSDKIETDFQYTDLLNFFERNFQNSKLENLVVKIKKLKQKIHDKNWLHQWNGDIIFQEFKTKLNPDFRTHYSINIDNPFLNHYYWFSLYQSLTNFQQQVLQKLFIVTNWKESF